MCSEDKRLSPAFLYWNAREADGKTDTDSGASLYDVLKGAADKGVCEEDQMPYNAKIFTVSPSEEAFADALGRRVLEAQTVELDMNAIKSALSDGCPVIIAAQIFDSFSETRSGFIRQPSKSEIVDGGRKDGHGRHAMVVCGFRIRRESLLCVTPGVQNSEITGIAICRIRMRRSICYRRASLQRLVQPIVA